MRKLAALRQHLLASVPGLANDPDRLRTYIPEGSIAFHRGQHLSHEYRFSAEIILIGHAGDIDVVALPILQWLGRFQPDADPNQAVRFSAEIHKHDDIDLIFALDLTERVVALVDCDAGEIRSEHRMPEYPIEHCPATSWQLLTKNPDQDEYQLASEWQSP